MSSAPDNAVPALADEVPTHRPPPARRARRPRHPRRRHRARRQLRCLHRRVLDPVPGIPSATGVPITLQTFAVILAGLVLGWRRGGLAALLYLAIGLAGVPIFAERRRRTGRAGRSVASGYLLAFPFGAAAAGALGSLAIRWSARAPRPVPAGGSRSCRSPGSRPACWSSTWPASPADGPLRHVAARGARRRRPVHPGRHLKSVAGRCGGGTALPGVPRHAALPPLTAP